MYWLATETSEHSQVLSLENWSQVPVLSYAYHTNWGIKWTSDSAGLLRVVPVRCRCKAGGLFYCWRSVCFPQYSELVGNDFGKEMLAILFACTWRWSYWCNLFRWCFLFSYMTKCIDTSADSGLAFKVGMKKKIESHTWKSSSSQGLLSTVPWQGVRALGERRLQLSGKSPV